VNHLSENNIHIPLSLLRLEGDGYHIFAKIKVNKVICSMLIDTGASKTVIDSNRISRFVDHNDFEENDQLSTGLGTDTMQSHLVEIDEIELGDIIIENSPVVIIDLSHVNNAYRKMEQEEIDGVLGSDILLQFNAVIDFGKLTLTLFQ
jgi:hypothetical protein